MFESNDDNIYIWQRPRILGEKKPKFSFLAQFYSKKCPKKFGADLHQIFWGPFWALIKKALVLQPQALFSKKCSEIAEIMPFQTQKRQNSLFQPKCWICWICSWGVPKKCASFWGNVEYVEYVECFLNLQTHSETPEKTTTFNITAVRSIFFENVLLSAVMLNMLNVLLVWFRKMCFFLGKCWICWICWMFFELTDPFGNPRKKQQHSTLQL